MSKYKKYQEYKDSGVEWLGLLPSTWEARRLGFYFSERREKVSDKDYPALSVTKQGIVPQLANAAKTDDGDNRKKVSAGDFVINSRSDRKGSSGLSELTGSVSLINTIITPKSINGRYTHNLLRSYPFQEEFYRYGKGIVADLWSTNYTSMKNITIPFPPLQEQQSIANYLDKATAKIDTLIEKQTKLIEILKEKRQAVISTAVTRGLDSSVPMKDSGVEWLGEIPEHWKALQLKRISSIKGGYAYSTTDFQDEGIQIIKIGNVYQSKFHTDRQPTFISENVAKKTKEFLIKEGDLIISLTGTLGKRDYGYAVTVDKKGEYRLNQRVAKMAPNVKLVKTSYLSYIMKSEQYLTQIYALPSGTKQANLSNDDVLSATCALPSLEEQEKIVQYIDIKTSQTDRLISKAAKAIDLLKEKRTALISAVVTGKIDIREDI